MLNIIHKTQKYSFFLNNTFIYYILSLFYIRKEMAGISDLTDHEYVENMEDKKSNRKYVFYNSYSIKE